MMFCKFILIIYANIVFFMPKLTPDLSHFQYPPARDEPGEDYLHDTIEVERDSPSCDNI